MSFAKAGLAVGLYLATSVAAQAQGADFYNGKTVSYIVATAPGGGYDTYGRLVAEYMQKHLPGSTFIVRNMPGAGHLIGANAVYASKPDGLTLGTFNTGLIYTQIASHKGIRFDLNNMSWIGKAATDPRVIVVASQSPIKSVADIANSKETPALPPGLSDEARDFLGRCFTLDPLQRPTAAQLLLPEPHRRTRA